MIKYGLKKNLPSGVLYNSQIGNLIFICGLIFKVSALPGVSAETMHSSLLWSYVFMSVLDMFPVVFAYIFMKLEADDFLVSINSGIYKAALFVMMLFLTMKSIICFAYASVYITTDLFTKVSPMLLVVAYMVPVVYLGVKGIHTIARIAEILMPITFIILLLNFVFIDTNMDFGRNLPVFAIEPKEFFVESLRFGSWLGDATPLIFLKIKKKKLPYIGINTFLLLSIILLTVFFGVSMYGDALSSVSNLIIRIASFNQFSTEIGRMEWTALFVVLVLIMVTLSYFHWAAAACSQRVFGSRLPMLILFPVILLAVVLGAPSIQSITAFATSWLGFVMFGLAMGGPIMITVLYLIEKHTFKKKGGVIPPSMQTLSCGEQSADGGEDGDFPTSVLNDNPLPQKALAFGASSAGDDGAGGGSGGSYQSAGDSISPNSNGGGDSQSTSEEGGARGGSGSDGFQPQNERQPKKRAAEYKEIASGGMENSLGNSGENTDAPTDLPTEFLTKNEEDLL
jgi:uncharacterized membrane protein YgcG